MRIGGKCNKASVSIEAQGFPGAPEGEEQSDSSTVSRCISAHPFYCFHFSCFFAQYIYIVIHNSDSI